MADVSANEEEGHGLLSPCPDDECADTAGRLAPSLLLWQSGKIAAVSVEGTALAVPEKSEVQIMPSGSQPGTGWL